MGYMDTRQRIKNVFSLVRRDLDAIIVLNEKSQNPSFSYLTGLSKGVFEGAVAVFEESGDFSLIMSKLDKSSIDISNATVYTADDKNGKKIKDILKETTSNFKTIGIDGNNISYSAYRGLRRILVRKRFIDVGKEILKSRLIKDTYEINCIKKACKIADRALADLPDIIKEGISEREVALELEYRMRLYGADEKSFDTIVAFGKNSAIPHHITSNRRLKRGDIVLIDMGARYNGYVSDITRSYVFGSPNDKQREMFDTVLHAQQIGINKIKEGTKFGEIFEIIHRYIENTKFKGKFIHSAGHTIGLEVHDGFSIAKGAKERFKNGITFTIEPGVYLKAFGGIRIEDDILIEDGRARVLTQALKEIEI